jgi:hypothetical protein
MKKKKITKKKLEISLGERQALLDAGDHGLMDLGGLAELALALRALARGEVAQAGFAAEQLASGGHFKTLCGGFFRLATCDGSWHGAGKVAGEANSASSFLGWRQKGAARRNGPAILAKAAS